ncbi:hypothetical protein ACNVED_07640 [Legionella sp. D16C41]|uniref:hypothetical protein n=1 Tax=Legionella sp. D16C41 TaxID=3402688 RepID=UPI003AF6071E
MIDKSKNPVPIPKQESIKLKTPEYNNYGAAQTLIEKSQEFKGFVQDLNPNVMQPQENSESGLSKENLIK